MTIMKDLAIGSSNYDNPPTQTPGRKKRNLIPFGGTALKWLFEVASSSPELVHFRRKTSGISQ